MFSGLPQVLTFSIFKQDAMMCSRVTDSTIYNSTHLALIGKFFKKEKTK